MATDINEKDKPMTRELTDHRINPANDKLRIEVLDEPGAGGACHLYKISGYDTGMDGEKNPCASREEFQLPEPVNSVCLLFQNGPIAEVGVNGITHEALLAILVDRMRAFQAGPYACRENALALTKLEEAQMWLLQRTKARMARGVEGTHEK